LLIDNQSALKEGRYMATPMTKSQLVTKLAENASLTKKAASFILAFIAKVAYKEAKNSFTLPWLGKLVLVQAKRVWVEILQPVKPSK
jgi:hypothetical protein